MENLKTYINFHDTADILIILTLCKLHFLAGRHGNQMVKIIFSDTMWSINFKLYRKDLGN